MVQLNNHRPGNNGLASDMQEQVSDLLHDSLPAICKLMRSPTGWVFLKNGDDFKLAATHGLPPALKAVNKSALRWQPCHCQKNFKCGILMNSIYITDCQRLQRAIGENHGLARHASVPLKYDDKHFGILNLAFPRDRQPFTDDELSVLATTGKLLSLAISRRLSA